MHNLRMNIMGTFHGHNHHLGYNIRSPDSCSDSDRSSSSEIPELDTQQHAKKASYWVQKALTAKDVLIFGTTPEDYEKMQRDKEEKEALTKQFNKEYNLMNSADQEKRPRL